jgi:hypothetical protein
MNATAAIASKIALFQDQHRSCQSIITENTAKLKGIEEKIALLVSIQQEIDAEHTDTNCLPTTTSSPPPSTTVITTTTRPGAFFEMEPDPLNPDGLKPADAIRGLLRKNPDGLTQSEIVTQLEDKITTTSPNKRRIIYNTIFNLRKAKKVQEVGVGSGKRLVLTIPRRP